jgi:hypothetical protein
LIVESNAAKVTVSSRAEAIEWTVGQCGASAPVAARVDTLLHWSDGPVLSIAGGLNLVTGNVRKLEAAVWSIQKHYIGEW